MVLREPNVLVPDVAEYVPGRPLIFRDLSWVEREPYLVVEIFDDVSGVLVPSGKVHRTPLSPGAFIGLDTRARVLADGGVSVEKYCGGYSVASTVRSGFYGVPCPEHAVIAKGKQCARCVGRDEFSVMHVVHRGARVSDAVRAYAGLEHWLYVATFPDGSSKVGTCSLVSRSRRVDEQAVGCATYVAHARDGLQVRVLEDVVSREASLPQGKLVSAKFRAWSDALPMGQLREAHGEAVALAQWVLREAAVLDGLLDEGQIISERWVPSAAMGAAYRALDADSGERLSGYPSLWGAVSGFYVCGATGKFVVGHCGNPQVLFLFNMAELSHRAFVPSWEVSVQPHTQASLF